MTAELKLCPICQASAETTHAQAYARCNNVQCPMHFIKQCGVGEWNTRPIEDAQAQAIAELVECINKIASEWEQESERQEDDYYNDCCSIDQITDALRELIAKHGKEESKC